MLIKRGICIKCGLAKAREGKYMCSWCQKEEEKKPKKSYYTRSPGNEPKQEKQKKQRKYTLDEVCQMARERGIGSWVTSALESNVGLSAIAQLAAHVYGCPPSMPQGLGTGQLFTDNIDMPLVIRGDQLWISNHF